MANGGSGPAAVAGSTQELGPAWWPHHPGAGRHAVDVSVPFGRPLAVVVGAPRLTLTYVGTTPVGSRPTRVFAQLVDPSTGLVLGNQVTPIDVTLDGHTHTTVAPLEMVAFTGRAHAAIELQLVATTVAYARPRFGGSVHFTGIGTLPAGGGAGSAPR